jgi:hypothetical protein
MKIQFPDYTGVRCLMMPYIQGEPDSVPDRYQNYRDILEKVFVRKGDVGYLTIDESVATAGKPHRGARAQHGRALHTEVGSRCNWGSGGTWGGRPNVYLDRDTSILLANNLNNSCAFWDAVHENTSDDGDIGDQAHLYPYEDAIFMQAGEVHRIGIFTPHESIPVKENVKRQFLRIISSGVHGRELYFTQNPLMEDRYV